MGKKYKIIFDRETCIGALNCNAIAPEFWLRAKDGKVDLKNAKYNKEEDVWELVIDEKDLSLNKEAEAACPVNVIKIIELKEE